MEGFNGVYTTRGAMKSYSCEIITNFQKSGRERQGGNEFPSFQRVQDKKWAVLVRERG